MNVPRNASQIRGGINLDRSADWTLWGINRV